MASPKAFSSPLSRRSAMRRPEGFALEVTHTLPADPEKTCFGRLILVTSGTGHFSLKSKRDEVSTGFVILVPPGIPFHFSKSEDLRMRVVCFNPTALHMKNWQIADDCNFKLLFSFVGSKADGGGRAGVLHFCLISRIFEQAVAQAAEIEREIAQQLPGWKDISYSHFQHMVVMLSRFHNLRLRTSHDSARRVAKAIRYIEKNFCEQIHMEDLAREAAISPRTFYRLFLQATGLTPNAHLKRARLNHAAEKLRLTDDTVTEIAFSSGFTDSNFFSREFHGAFAMSPTHYRRIWQA